MNQFLLGVTAGLAVCAIVVGQLQSSFIMDCTETGETRIGDTFYSCEPVGAMVNGERRAFKETYNQP